MDIKKQLYLGVAAIGVAGFLAAAPTQLRAQTAVAIDNDDISASSPARAGLRRASG